MTSDRTARLAPQTVNLYSRVIRANTLCFAHNGSPLAPAAAASASATTCCAA
jgi:hypothetical protein